MNRFYTLIASFFLSAYTFSQAPEMMSYQAVIRDGSNNLVSSSSIGMQISILQGSASGTTVYTETQTPISNANGLVSIQIGNGAIVSGSFAAIDWSNGPYFIKTETDPSGGTAYSITGTSELLSVPYALHAKTAESVTNDLVDDADADPTNELQNLSLSGTNLSITSGNTVDLSSLPDDGDWVTSGTNIYNANSGNLGVGTNSPNAKLHVNGDVRIVTGSEGTDKVLMSDANGNAEWKYALTPLKAGSTSDFSPNVNDYSYRSFVSITPEQSGIIKIHISGDMEYDGTYNNFIELGYQITIGNSPPNGFAFNKSCFVGRDAIDLAPYDTDPYESWSVVGSYNVVAGITYYIWLGSRAWSGTLPSPPRVRRVSGVVTLHTTNGL